MRGGQRQPCRRVCEAEEGGRRTFSRMSSPRLRMELRSVGGRGIGWLGGVVSPRSVRRCEYRGARKGRGCGDYSSAVSRGRYFGGGGGGERWLTSSSVSYSSQVVAEWRGRSRLRPGCSLAGCGLARPSLANVLVQRDPGDTESPRTRPKEPCYC